MKSIIVVILAFINHVSSMEGITHTVTGTGMPHIGHVDTCVDGPLSVDGTLQTARFNYPWGITFSPEINSIFVADCGCIETPHSNDRIRMIDLRNDIVLTIAGNEQGYRDGPKAESRFYHSAGLALDSKNKVLFVADSGNDVIRAINLRTHETETMKIEYGVNDAEKKLENPQEIALWDDGKSLLISDTDNHAIRKVDFKSMKIQTVAGMKYKQGFKDGDFQTAEFYSPTGLAVDKSRRSLYVSDHYNHAIRKLDFEKREVITLAGTGKAGLPGQGLENGTTASLYYPEGLALDEINDVLYIAEFGSNCIRILDLQLNTMSVLAGSGGFGSMDAVGLDAQFYHPTDIALDSMNKVLYVSDQYNHRIRSVTALGNQKTANRAQMLVNHVFSHHGYTDIFVHHKLTFSFIFFVIIVASYSFYVFVKRPKMLLRKKI